MDLGSGKGFGAVLRRRVRGGQIRSILPAWRIALHFEKGAKLRLVIKKGQKYGTIFAEVR